MSVSGESWADRAGNNYTVKIEAREIPRVLSRSAIW